MFQAIPAARRIGRGHRDAIPFTITSSTIIGTDKRQDLATGPGDRGSHISFWFDGLAGRAGHANNSGQDGLFDATFHIGQSHVAAGMPESQPLMVEAEKVKQRSMPVVNMHLA